jgi:ketosteroid isomerase-like protein
MKIPSILYILFMLLPLAVNATEQDTATAIIALERAALERWNQGDPDGFLEISDQDVVYFDPFLERRLNGIEELKALYEGIRGMVQVDSYEIIDPKVHASESIAVLTYNLVSRSPQRISKWNCTEVYRRNTDGHWRIIQTHWSLTKPSFASNP